MFHSNTELLIDYWRGLRGDDAVPARNAVEPAGFVALAPRTFIASQVRPGEFAFRLAGEALIDLHGRQLRDGLVSRLWRPLQRRRLAGLLEATLLAGEPLVVAAEGWSEDGAHLRLEVSFLPLSGPDGDADRFLGLYQPTLGSLRTRICELALLAAYGVADEREPLHLRLATLDGRRIA
ncbi:MAG TPA: PAS domain-containing protein [Caulobacteraceae bacterium]|jgi:hypothetical protein|nr:PAS domain-containing protein [Caulobacteraceae bacterium]